MKKVSRKKSIKSFSSKNKPAKSRTHSDLMNECIVVGTPTDMKASLRDLTQVHLKEREKSQEKKKEKCSFRRNNNLQNKLKRLRTDIF